MSEGGVAGKAFELIKDLSRKQDGIPPYNEELVGQVIGEVNGLVSLNHSEVELVKPNLHELYPSLHARHAVAERNKRCLMAYHLNRLERIKESRWSTGSVLAPVIRANLSDSETEWFNLYNRCLSKYMQSLGGDGNDGLDLTQDQQPPKSLYIQVRVKTDYGEFETSDGTVLLLKPDSVHSLLRSDCERLIRENVLEQIHF